jgi:hypothetical protein
MSSGVSVSFLELNQSSASELSKSFFSPNNYKRLVNGQLYILFKKKLICKIKSLNQNHAAASWIFFGKNGLFLSTFTQEKKN